MAGIEGLLSGHTLAGRYRIEEVIGRGGYAAVYRAKDERLRRTVAVKVVMVAAPDDAARERIRARFHREARVAAQLQHKNVVTIYDFGTDETLSLDFLVMELLHGEDLAARVARLGPPPMELSLRILREAAEGLAAGHKEGLVHRDVKPGNVFLEERSGMDVFRVCVLDFGIAQVIEGDETVTSLTHGRMPLSPSYAAPEHLRDERPLTRAADVYGLGVIGYELLTGTRLFEKSLAESARQSVPSLRSRNPEVPTGIAAVIERALAYHPSERFADAAELVRALEAAEAAAPFAALHPPETSSPHLHAPAPSGTSALPPDGKAYRARRYSRLPEEAATPVRAERPTRAGLPLALLAVLALVAVGGWWALRGDGERAEAEVGAVPPAVATSMTNDSSETFAGGLTTPLPAEGAALPAERPPAASAPDPAPGGATGGGTAGGGGSPAGAPPAAAAPGARSAAALHAQGLRLFQAGDAARAVERFRGAVAEAPGNASYRNDLGWALFVAGSVAEAGRELEEVVRLAPAREIAYANLGEVRLAEGDTAEAVRLYERFIDLNRDPRREVIAERKLARIR